MVPKLEPVARPMIRGECACLNRLGFRRLHERKDVYEKPNKQVSAAARPLERSRRRGAKGSILPIGVSETSFDQFSNGRGAGRYPSVKTEVFDRDQLVMGEHNLQTYGSLPLSRRFL
jgi:hypothetical protein